MDEVPIGEGVEEGVDMLSSRSSVVVVKGV